MSPRESGRSSLSLRRITARLLPPAPPAADPTDDPNRSASRMGAATAASRSIGFIRIWVIATVLGTTYLGNAYQSSSSVSNVLFELLAAGALSAVLVPTFVELLDAGKERDAQHLAAGLLGLSLLVMGAISLVGVIAAPWLARVLTSGAPSGPVGEQQLALSTFLLRFFVPQVMFYVFGTIATAVLFAKRSFVVPALAPVANTVVVVIVMITFRVLHGPHASLDLDLTEKLVLAIGGTIGVLGFCAVPVIALRRTGFRLVPAIRPPDAALRRLLRLSSWAVLQHSGIGILLAASIVAGNAVEGGTVAYQFAFVAFMAPYAILAQPVHTTILPSLALDASRDNRAAFASRVRWALGSLALLTLPVSALIVALAEPAMRVITVGASRGGAEIVAAALASLAVGLFGYSAFLLLARSYYALGESRLPALVAVGTACVGAALMLAGGALTHGTARVAALGIGHSVAYTVGAVILGIALARRLGHPLLPPVLWRTLLVSTVLGAIAWWVQWTLHPRDRIAALLTVLVIGGVGVALYLAMLRLISGSGVTPRLGPTPDDADVGEEL